MLGDAFSPVNLLEAGGSESKGEQARMVRVCHQICHVRVPTY